MSQSDASDRTLAERTLRGDGEAFAVLHKRYYARIYRLALLRCRNAADAEDVASETFVRALTHLPTFRFAGETLLPWLARIAGNLSTDLGRRHEAGRTVSYDAEAADGVRRYLEALPDSSSPDPQTLSEREETRLFLRDAVAKLPHEQAEAVWLRFGGDLPLKEIGAAMGKTEGAIKSLLHRALGNLRKNLLAQAEETAQIGALRRETTARWANFGEEVRTTEPR